MPKNLKFLVLFFMVCFVIIGISGNARADGCSYYIDVPHITQVPPGDWQNTKNCGQACAVMLGGYFNSSPVNSTAITAQNTWLYYDTSDSNFLDSNGYYTGGTYGPNFVDLLEEYHGLTAACYTGGTMDDIFDSGCDGDPVIVMIHISEGQLVTSGGVAHWAIVVGCDGYNIVLTDPGTSSGDGIYYDLDDFEDSWDLEGNIYIPVSD